MVSICSVPTPAIVAVSPLPVLSALYTVASPATVKVLTVPTQAVLPTGTQNLVFVNRGDGEFVPRAVALGTRGDSLVEIVHGLKPGDEVIASAAYLLDSESNLAAAMQGLMLQMGMGLDMGRMETQDGKDGGMEGMKMGEESLPRAERGGKR